MKTVAVYFTDPDYDGYPFTKEEYRDSYRDLARIVAQKGGQFVIVRGLDTYKGKMNFSHYWKFENDDFHFYDEPITVDILYDKGEDFPPDPDVLFLNDPAFDAVCSDKQQTALMFPTIVPKTIIVSSKEELADALDQLKTETVVAKPIDGAEGRGIFIESKQEIQQHVTEFPYLLQEYIDTSGGIPGLVEGLHDFRMISIDGEIVVSYIRIPKEGLLIANISMGGKEIEVLPEDIPKEALELYRMVDQMLSMYPKRVYTVDVARDKSGDWKLIELNGKPGLSPISMGKSYETFYDRLANLLLQ